MVSVIVPVYNAEKTLHRCIDSILEAGKKYEIEIILVNDGSEDSSERICLEYSKLYSNIHYFVQNNLGVSVARNKGINAASGKWIHFVDSDDWVKPDIYIYINEAEVNDEIDFIMFRYDKCIDNKQIDLISSKGEICNNKQILYAVLNNILYGGYCWNKIFKRNIIKENHIHFDKEIKLCEDQLFQIDYLQYVRLGYILPNMLYCYQSINGGTHYNLAKSITAIKAYDRIIQMDFVKNNVVVMNEAKINYVSNCLKIIGRAIKSKKMDVAHEYKKLLRQYIKAYLKSKRPKLRHKIAAVMICMCPII